MQYFAGLKGKSGKRGRRGFPGFKGSQGDPGEKGEKGKYRHQFIFCSLTFTELSYYAKENREMGY